MEGESKGKEGFDVFVLIDPLDALSLILHGEARACQMLCPKLFRSGSRF